MQKETSMSEQVLLVEEKDGVAVLTLNRPQVMNSFNFPLLNALMEHVDALRYKTDIRVVIITGSGQKAFCAGADLKERATLDEQQVKEFIFTIRDLFTSIEYLNKPVIAAVNGVALGGGTELTLACDIRIASKDAIFSTAETRIAIIADMGTLQRLPTIIGQSWIRELALTGRFFTAAEALQMGLITHLCEDRESLYNEAKKLAKEIAANSPLTVQGTKDVINYSRDNGIYQGLDYVAQKNAAMLISEDLMEAFQAFLEKRPPKFKGK